MDNLLGMMKKQAVIGKCDCLNGRVLVAINQGRWLPTGLLTQIPLCFPVSSEIRQFFSPWYEETSLTGESYDLLWGGYKGGNNVRETFLLRWFSQKHNVTFRVRLTWAPSGVINI